MIEAGFFWITVQSLGHWVGLAVLTVTLGQGLLHLALLAVALMVMAVRAALPPARRLWSDLVDIAPSLTILVPAHNEELTVEEAVRALLSLQYPDFEVIVVNDGSEDTTLDRLRNRFSLEPEPLQEEGLLPHAPVRAVYRSREVPRLRVIDKERGGKADALNAGINLVETELFCAVDADSILEPDALLRAVQLFVEGGERTVAVGGTVRVANGCRVRGGRVVEVGLPRHPLAILQAMEYLRAFSMARLALAWFGALFIVSGAFGIFRRAAVVEIGGYDTATVGEDLELVLRLHRTLSERGREFEIRYVPEPVCWTQVPERVADLARQRIRWHRGALESVARHAAMLGRWRYRGMGLLGLPSLVLIDLVGPLVEAAGYVLMPAFWLLDAIDGGFLLAWLLLTVTFGAAISAGSLILEELELRRYPRVRHLAILVAAAFLENIGYRQLHNLWRILGHLHYLRGARGWGGRTRMAFRSG